MTAEFLGGRLLGEVKEESLDELLRALHHFPTAQVRDRLHIPGLDQLLADFEYGPVAASQPYTQPAPTKNKKTKKKNPIINIIGPTCSGKTHLLYYITAMGVLPRARKKKHVNGKEGVVVILDADGRFDVCRLRQVMRSCCMQGRANNLMHGEDEDDDDEKEVEEMLQTSLQHIHIFRPDSLSALEATISFLPTYLSNPSPSHTRPLHAILLDSITAFYWQTRLEQLTTTTTTTNPNTTTAHHNRITHLINSLRGLQSAFFPTSVVAYTTATLFPTTTTTTTTTAPNNNDNNNDNANILQLFPQRLFPFSSSSHQNTRASFPLFPLFPPGTSAEEALALTSSSFSHPPPPPALKQPTSLSWSILLHTTPPKSSSSFSFTDHGFYHHHTTMTTTTTTTTTTTMVDTTNENEHHGLDNQQQPQAQAQPQQQAQEQRQRQRQNQSPADSTTPIPPLPPPPPPSPPGVIRLFFS